MGLKEAVNGLIDLVPGIHQARLRKELGGYEAMNHTELVNEARERGVEFADRTDDELRAALAPEKGAKSGHRNPT